MNLKEIRENSKKSQQDVATFLGVSRQCYNNYELGKRQPDPDTLIKIATYFNVSVDYLLGSTPAPTPTDYDKELEGVDYALMSETMGLSDSDKEDVLKFVRFLRSKKEEE